MKKVLAMFAGCFVFWLVFLMVGGSLVFSSVWGILCFASLVSAGVILLFQKVWDKIADLEARIQALESLEPPEEEFRSLGSSGEEL